MLALSETRVEMEMPCDVCWRDLDGLTHHLGVFQGVWEQNEQTQDPGDMVICQDLHFLVHFTFLHIFWLPCSSLFSSISKINQVGCKSTTPVVSRKGSKMSWMSQEPRRILNSAYSTICRCLHLSVWIYWAFGLTNLRWYEWHPVAP